MWLNTDLQDSIMKNLPSQVADQLKERLAELEQKEISLDEANKKIEDIEINQINLEEEIRHLNKKLQEAKDKIEEYKSKESELTKRENEVFEREKRQELDLMRVKLEYSDLALQNNFKLVDKVFSNRTLMQSVTTRTDTERWPDRLECRSDWTSYNTDWPIISETVKVNTNEVINEDITEYITNPHDNV